MKYAWMPLSCVVVLIALVSTVAAQANAQTNACEVVPPVDPCQGRTLFDVPGGIPCGCHGQALCDLFQPPPCDPGRESFAFGAILPPLLCEYTKLSAEPTTNSTVIVPTQDDPAELFGWADVHQHQFANLAYGGANFWGKVFDTRGVNAALARCDYSWDFSVRTPSFGSGITIEVKTWPTVLGIPLPPQHSWGWPIHGSLWATPLLAPFVPLQWVRGAMNNIATQGDPFVTHRAGGIGPFDGWPTWDNGGHQQMYYKWLERAYQGGLRLLVNLVVNNEVLCKSSYQRAGFGECQDSNGELTGQVCSSTFECNFFAGEKCLLCNDMLTAERQIDRIHALERFIDDEVCGVPGSGCGWYRVATSSQQAREIISGGKMAVVIGIEVDSLFDCKPDADFCNEAHIGDRLDHFYGLGLRYVFPVHAFDNKFAGSALYNDIFAYANWLATGGVLKTWDCSSKGYNYKIEFNATDPLDYLGLLYSGLVFLFGQPDFDPTQVAHCNAKGLTPEGEILLNVLMEKDMIIDIDHLSYRALEGFVNKFPVPGFPPLDQGQNQCEDGSQCDPSHPDACQGIGDASCDVKGALEIFEDKNGERGYAYPVMSGHPAIMEDYKVCGGNRNGCTTDDDCPAGQSCILNKMCSGDRNPCTTNADCPAGQSCNLNKIDAEYNHTVSRVKRIRDLGGVVALRAPGDGGTTRQFKTGVGETFGYNRIVDIMDGDNDECDDGSQCDPSDPDACQGIGDQSCDPDPFYGEGHPGIAYTNDMGSFLKQTGPRGPNVDPNEPCLEYPFEAFDGSGVFFRQQTGDRIFDFNNDGLAHIGLMPDLLADVRNISPEIDLDPLFNSAETFIRMWERIENCTPDIDAPVISCPPTISVSAGPMGTEVFYDPPTAEDFCDKAPVVTTDIPSGSVFGIGVTTVTATATDASGNTSTCTFDVAVSCFGVHHLKIGVKRGHKNRLELKGAFRAAAAFDPRAAEVSYSIDDGNGHTFDFFIPAGSFEIAGDPAGHLFMFDSAVGNVPDIKAKFNLHETTFQLTVKDVLGAEDIVGTALAAGVRVVDGLTPYVGQETVETEVKPNHLKYNAHNKVRCRPSGKDRGSSSLQLDSGAASLPCSFVPLLMGLTCLVTFRRLRWNRGAARSTEFAGQSNDSERRPRK